MSIPGQWNHDFAEEPTCRLQEAREKAFEDFLENGEIPGMAAESLALLVSDELLDFIRSGEESFKLRGLALAYIDNHITQTITEGYLND